MWHISNPAEMRTTWSSSACPQTDSDCGSCKAKWLQACRYVAEVRAARLQHNSMLYAYIIEKEVMTNSVNWLTQTQFQ